MSTENLNTDSVAVETEDFETSMASFFELKESDKVQKVPEKKRRFSRRTRNLIFTSGGAVLTACAVLLLSLTGQQQATTPNQTPDTPQADVEVQKPIISLLDKTNKENKPDIKAAHLQQIDIENKDDSFSIKLDSTKGGYVIVGYEDLSLDSTIVTTLRAYTETIEAIDRIEEKSDLAVYGLDKPQASASITYDDGTTSRIVVGKSTPTDTGYYGTIEGDENVYIFGSDNVALFRFRSTAFVSTLLVATPSIKEGNTDDRALLKEITYSGSAFPTPLVMRRSYHSDLEEYTLFPYIITSPYVRTAKDEVFNTLGTINSITADQALVLHPTEEQKKQMGFDDPLFEMKLTMAVETEDSEAEPNEKGKKPNKYYNSMDSRIVVGSTDDNGNYIVMVDGINAIYLINKNTGGFLFERTYHNSVNPSLFTRYIYQKSRISIQLGDQAYDFDLTHYPEKEEKDDQLIVKMGDTVYPTEDFRMLYRHIMDLERYGTTEEQPSGEVPLIVSMYDLEGNLFLSAKYYVTSASLCTVETSEGECFTTRWSDVDFLIQQVQNYISGKPVLYK